MSENAIETRIMDAALDVVADKKISGTTIRVIAKEADVAASHIQYYFHTKKELMVALLESVLKTFLKDRKELMDASGPALQDKLSVFFKQKTNVIQNKKKCESAQFDFWVQNLIDEDINGYFVRSYDSWRENIRVILRNYIPGLDPVLLEYIPYMMVSMMQGATMQYYVEESFDLEAYFSVCLDMILKTVDAAHIEE